MSIASFSEAQIKALFKQAMVELIEECKDLFYDLFTEVLEELALVNAIKEGEDSESVSRADVFRVLEAAT